MLTVDKQKKCKKPFKEEKRKYHVGKLAESHYKSKEFLSESETDKEKTPNQNDSAWKQKRGACCEKRREDEAVIAIWENHFKILTEWKERTTRRENNTTSRS